MRTFQSVDGPLLELLECYVCCWRDLIEVQTKGIVLLLVCGSRELLLFVVKGGSSFGVNPVHVLSNHFES